MIFSFMMRTANSEGLPQSELARHINIFIFYSRLIVFSFFLFSFCSVSLRHFGINTSYFLS